VLPRHVWPLGGISWAPQSEYLKRSIPRPLSKKPYKTKCSARKRQSVAYMVFKNELGLCGAETLRIATMQDGDWPGLQAALSLRKHISQNEVKLFMVTLDLIYPHSQSILVR
jgi:hypothetical protein